MAKSMKLGGGGRFQKGEEKLEAKGMPKSEAGAIMAKAGDKKYGKTRMTKMAQAGKKRAQKSGR